MRWDNKTYFAGFMVSHLILNNCLEKCMFIEISKKQV